MAFGFLGFLVAPSLTHAFAAHLDLSVVKQLDRLLAPTAAAPGGAAGSAFALQRAPAGLCSTWGLEVRSIWVLSAGAWAPGWVLAVGSGQTKSSDSRQDAGCMAALQQTPAWLCWVSHPTSGEV